MCLSTLDFLQKGVAGFLAFLFFRRQRSQLCCCRFSRLLQHLAQLRCHRSAVPFQQQLILSCFLFIKGSDLVQSIADFPFLVLYHLGCIISLGLQKLLH